MDDHARAFNGLRPRLQKIAYRMLGSVAEAEDIVQDVWLRWHAAAREAIDNAEAWLSPSPRGCPLTVCARRRFNANTTQAYGCLNPR